MAPLSCTGLQVTDFLLPLWTYFTDFVAGFCSSVKQLWNPQCSSLRLYSFISHINSHPSHMVSLPPNTKDSFSYLLFHNKPPQHLVAYNIYFYYFLLVLVLTGQSCLAFLLYMTPALAPSFVGSQCRTAKMACSHDRHWMLAGGLEFIWKCQLKLQHVSCARGLGSV